LSKDEERSLVALGQLWGFLKYHHPAVAKGDYDWDAKLIKLIPQILEAKNDSVWKKMLDNWMDSLPSIPENPNKKLPDLEIKMKPDYGELFNTDYFFPETIDKIKYILDNAVVSINHYINVDMKQIGQLTITNEPSYSEMLYPELPYRLLALFRHWNIVNYFFPHRELCDQQWSTVLADMLPEFVNAKNQEDYIFACMKLIAKIDDSHGFFSPDLKTGLLKAPFEVQFIEDRLVVTTITGADVYVKDKIEIGDVITNINGESVEDIVKRMLPYTSASNYPVKLRQISSNILTGNSNSATIDIQRNGESFKIKIPYCDYRLLNIPNHFSPQPNEEGYRILDNNIGYMLPSSCKEKEREAGIKKILDGTKGIIIDFRCYPDDYNVFAFIDKLNLWTISNKISHASITYPGYFFMLKNNNSQRKGVSLSHYIPKVVVMVNEYTQSAAEDEVMYYQNIPGLTVIGSTTAGADGRVVRFNLPGNIRTAMTGVGVFYPDGEGMQRVGVRIDEIVKPTIAGIKAGRDELLERAIEIINESNR
jgi:C-terminal processing protease CtpA/Prc